MRLKRAEAVQLSKLHGIAEVDRAPGHGGDRGPRFAGNDLISILDHHIGRQVTEPTRASEGHSLKPGTSDWSRYGVAPEGNER